MMAPVIPFPSTTIRLPFHLYAKEFIMETKNPSTGAAGTSGEGAAAGEQPVASQSTAIAPLPHDAGRTSGSDAGAGHSGPQRPGMPPYTILLACGIASSVLYIAADITGAIRYVGYSYADHTFSELLAVGSPVRSLLIGSHA